MKSLLILLLAPVVFFSCKTRTAEGKDESAKPATTTSDGSVQFADEKYVDIGRRHDIMFENGNINGWAEMFADDAVLMYSGGEKFTGKQAIVDYWINRRNTVVQSIAHDFDIYLPVTVKESLQPGTKAPGVWLMHWTQFTTRYQNGKSLTGWLHTDLHFDDNGKVDRMIEYLDRAPIQAASGMK